MKLCTTQTKNTNTVNVLITSTHTFMWLLPCSPEQDRYRVRALHHSSAITNIINLLSSLREREREIDTTNRMRHRQVPFNDKTICIGGTHTQSHAHVRGSPTPLHQTRDTQAVQTSIMCGKAILRRALELDETQIPSWMHDSFLDEKCFITRKSH